MNGASATNLGGAIIALLESERVELRAAAVTVLAAVGKGDKSVEAALTGRLADADAVVQQLRTFGDDKPKPATVQPSQVKVRVVDATGTGVGASAVRALAFLGFQATDGKPQPTIAVTEIRYGYGQSEEAIALLDYIPDAKLVPDPTAKDSVYLVLGSSYPGTITLPTTTTTLPGTPVTTAPPSTTTTLGPAPSDPCS